MRVHAALNKSVVHRRAGVEVLVQRRLPKADPAGDLGQVQRRDPLFGHHRQRRVQDFFTPLRSRRGPAAATATPADTTKPRSFRPDNRGFPPPDNRGFPPNSASRA